MLGALAQALGELTSKGVGCLLVVDARAGKLLGTFTDGDLRRTLQGRGAQVPPAPCCSPDCRGALCRRNAETCLWPALASLHGCPT